MLSALWVQQSRQRCIHWLGEMLDVVAKRQDLTAPDVEIDECWNIRSQDYSFPRTFVPWTVRSLERSRERIVLRTNVPDTEVDDVGLSDNSLLQWSSCLF